MENAAGKKGWGTEDAPLQNGQIVIVTGGARGLGYEISLALAVKGAKVILASRNKSNGLEALEKIKSIHPKADVSFEMLDLGSLASIKIFCLNFNAKQIPLDILINNAGLGSDEVPLTEDGFEAIFGTNHLGHFALTAQLLPSLRRSYSPRVVTVASLLHRIANLQINDLQSLNKPFYWSYSPFYLSYCNSKLANLLFMLELQQKSNEEGWGIISLAAHPGHSRTDMTAYKDKGSEGLFKFVTKLVVNASNALFSQSAEEGALPILYAAVSPEAIPGQYYGPDGFLEISGKPTIAFIHSAAKNKETAAELWKQSNELTNVTWT